MSETIEFKLNGAPVRIETDGERKLLWVLRADLGLTGTKYGCGQSHCGSCTVLVDGKARRSCAVAVRDVRGKEVVTIEGLARDGALHPLQKAFVDAGAIQCGFCTPGMVLAAHALLREKPHPTREEIIEGMEGNLCRCGAYGRIVDAIAAAAKEMGGGSR